MAERLRRAGHEVVGYDAVRARQLRRRRRSPTPSPRSAPVPDGWCGSMVPAGDADRAGGRPSSPACSPPATSSSTAATAATRDSIRRGAALAAAGIGFVDCGTSGGVWGLDNGYCLMVGGSASRRRHGRSRSFDALAPRGRLRPRRARRRRALHEDGPQRHRVRDDAGLRRGRGAPRHQRARHRRRSAGLGSWRQGSVVRSWLLDLLVEGAGARAPTSTTSRRWPRTPARAAGPSRRRSASACRRR